jgi:hypothetical protein
VHRDAQTDPRLDDVGGRMPDMRVLIAKMRSSLPEKDPPNPETGVRIAQGNVRLRVVGPRRETTGQRTQRLESRQKKIARGSGDFGGEIGKSTADDRSDRDRLGFTCRGTSMRAPMQWGVGVRPCRPPLERRNRIMATMKKDSKGQVAAVAKQLIAGAEKHLTGVTQVPLAGGSYTPAQITSTLQSLVNLRSDVDASKASTRAKIANEATRMPALRAFLSAFESFVKGAFGPSPDVLADFGIIPKVRVPLTVEAKAAAAAKRASTRAARHTLGTKQKKAVKGDVTGVLVTPITAPPPNVTAPSSPTAPATSTGPTAASKPIEPTAPATSGSSPSTGAAATPHTA